MEKTLNNIRFANTILLSKTAEELQEMLTHLNREYKVGLKMNRTTTIIMLDANALRLQVKLLRKFMNKITWVSRTNIKLRLL